MPDSLPISWQVILNPNAGGGKGLRDKDKIANLLKKANLKAEMLVSSYPGHSIEIARDIVSKGATHILVAGGDGTLNEVVNGIFLSGSVSPIGITIGMIPVGTGNDWIKTFGIPDHYQKAIDLIIKGKTVLQDVGQITISGKETSTRYFANIAGFGFDAMVAKEANSLKFKGISGIRVYIQSLLSSFFSYKPCMTRITIDGEELNVNLFSASVGLGKFNGGGMMQVPEANPLQGLFHVTLIRKIGVWGILTNFKGLYSGKFILDKRVSTHAGREIEISSSKPLPGEADGENLGSGTFRIRMIPHGLKVIYGSGEYLGM
jgi:YegS/Rv2252/BmrU family lipid kinase